MRDVLDLKVMRERMVDMSVVANNLLKKHTFCFNKNDNGGESLVLSTKMFSNGDPDGVYYEQEISLQSYCNSATLHLVGASITPALLRKLADELEALEQEAKELTR